MSNLRYVTLRHVYAYVVYAYLKAIKKNYIKYILLHSVLIDILHYLYWTQAARVCVLCSRYSFSVVAAVDVAFNCLIFAFVCVRTNAIPIRRTRYKYSEVECAHG